MKIYLVGGAVRDYFLKLPIKDRDWVVVGSTPKELLKKNFKQVGKDFPVFLHPETFEEYALARTEKKYNVGYTGFKTNYSKTVTLHEDLLRRDLTINAIAQDKYGNFIDPTNGIQHIKLRLLKHISESFQEDPLRVLRVARFAAQLAHLGFQIDKDTMRLMNIIVKNGELSFLTSHRVWNETKKALLTYSPHVYFLTLKKCHALSILFPEINNLYKIKKNYYFYSIKNLGDHFLFSLSNFAKKNKSIDMRFAFFCQFFIYYKKFYQKDFLNQDSIYQSDLIKNMFLRLDIPLSIRKLSYIVAKNYFFLHNIFFITSKEIVNLFNRMDIWRDPSKLLKISILSEYCIFFSKCIHIYKKNYISCFFKIIFLIINSIPIKFIIKEGFKGYLIKQELTRLRIFILDIYRSKVFLLK
ncbi:tRNA CCA-pyrophosphorylase [Buchnera aphidicola]|uniref:tRNA CCA-pyrophosphorylase n=1 Tax=Buchnera aphidicola TaxID=9 RepID=UPI00223844D3|nr:tRNA CCA-pyrophosphorylase [Buchnera aphidicola]MCW5197378.1 tRNA CCA-pyrophosphorylase [Buchnera aphidicola (Chaitophorus viminalis)]